MDIQLTPGAHLASCEARPYGSRRCRSSVVGRQAGLDSEARSLLDISRSAHLAVRLRPNQENRSNGNILQIMVA